jgi:F-type H+-transporting ATPase subunit delta
MPKQANARRYAQAVFEIAREKNELEPWRKDLGEIAAAESDAELAAILESPKIRFDDKAKLLAARLQDVSQMALNLARLLVMRNGIAMVGEIVKEYESLVDAYYGVLKAEVVTAVPIDDDDKKKLAENLGRLVGSKIVLEPKVDPGILGGVIARVGGKLLDGSTRSKLVALKRELAAGSK